MTFGKAFKIGIGFAGGAILGVAAGSGASAQQAPVQIAGLEAQGGLLEGVLGRARRAAERKVDEALRLPRTSPSPAPSRVSESPSPTPSRASRSPGATAAGPIGPSATVLASPVPQNLWLSVQSGRKFIAPEGKPQIIATNPYLNPDNFLFAKLRGMDCAPDGSLIVAGEGWENGDISGMGWWRIARDGAVTSIAGTPWGQSNGLPVPYSFSIAPDGSLLTMSHGVLSEVRDGRVRTIAGLKDAAGFQDGQAETARFKDSGEPLRDPQGHIWLSDQGWCTLRRIAPDGTVTTVIGQERSGCGDLPPAERIMPSSIAWDATTGELITAGSTITARPTHDMHITIWRLRPDGAARRVYYTMKYGRSPVGQNVDHIWAVAVDPHGRIVVGTRSMGGRARRQIMRLDETTGRLIPLTGQAFSNADLRPGHEEAPYDGPAAHASFRETSRLCYAPDRTLFVLDEHLIRRLDPDGNVRSWAY